MPRANKSTIKLALVETVERICVKVNTPEKMSNQDANIEAFIMPTQKTISLDLGKFSEAMKKMNPAQLDALGRSMILIATTAKKYIK